MSAFIEKFERIEQAGNLWNKGYKFTEIANELGIAPAQASALVREYKEFLKQRAESDPDFLERLTENTLEMIDSMDLILKETWDAHRQAKEFEALNMITQTLKLAMDITERKAKLLQLMGAKVDGNNMAKMARVEMVNEIISDIIQQIVSECPRCRQLAEIKLAEAFSMMGKPERASTMEEYEDKDDEIVVAELVEETHDHEAMLREVISED